MPQEPKKKHSRQRKGKRRASIKLKITKSVICANCGSLTRTHRICQKCGYYKGKEVIAPKTTKKRKKSDQK